MSTEASMAPDPLADRPYAPSWVNVLIGWIERLPGPAWVFYLLLLIPAIIMSNAQNWLSGLAPTGQFSIAQTFWGATLPALLWLIHHLDGVARASFEAFRPALGTFDTKAARLRYELLVIPARPAAAVAVIMLAFTLMYYVTDPVGSQIVGLAPGMMVFRALSEWVTSALILMLIYHTLRQLRSVSRIHELAPRVDLYQPAPLYAFSRLTARNAIALILITFAIVAVDPQVMTGSSALISQWWIALTIVVATAAFVVPLQGMHGRLVAEKHRLQAEAGAHLAAVISDVHGAVERDDLSGADGLSKLMASLVSEREVVARLPTWPWQPGTVGGFVGAILLPIGLWLATRLLEKVV